MANSDWYPARLADRVPWHANFNTQSVATGTAHGLTAGQVTQITADATAVASMINYLELVDDFAQAVTEYKNLLLDAPIGATLPAVPTPPAALTTPLGVLASIQPRTRQYAAILRASVGWTEALSELYGLSAPAGSGPGTPAITSATALVGSNVALALAKAGYDVLAVDMRRGGGAFNQIGIAQTATFTDTTDEADAGQPEQREYRVQGMVANARVGTLSAVVSVVTVP